MPKMIYTLEYLRNAMQYWLAKSEEYRGDYINLAADAKNKDKDSYWWDTHPTAKGIIANQRDARDECQKYALAYLVELFHRGDE